MDQAPLPPNTIAVVNGRRYRYSLVPGNDSSSAGFDTLSWVSGYNDSDAAISPTSKVPLSLLARAVAWTQGAREIETPKVGDCFAVQYFDESETLEAEVEEVNTATDTIRFKIIGSNHLHVVGSTVKTTLAGFQARAWRYEQPVRRG